MALSGSTEVLLAGGALVIAMLALAASVLSLAGQRRVRRAYRAFSGGRRGDVLTFLEHHTEEVQRLWVELEAQRQRAEELRELISAGISRIATVRYDAFEDMSGRFSFSAALLDEHGDGLVITAMNGRRDARTYIKPVLRGDSQRHLSEEEREAIDRAASMQGRRTPRRPRAVADVS